MNFIVRVSIDASGQLHGTVTLAQTGRKERFEGSAQLGELIAAMARARQDAASPLDRLDEAAP